jgi:hypothetical protein
VIVIGTAAGGPIEEASKDHEGHQWIDGSPPGACSSRGRPSSQHVGPPHWSQLPEHLGLHVSIGAVPDVLTDAECPWEWIQVTPDTAVVHFGDGVRLQVSHGREVIVQWDEESDPTGDPSWILQGWAVTLASLQRGNLSLHAATVRIGDTYVAIAGDRGAGKSTTAMGLRRRGHQLLVDDVTLLEFREGEAWTTPFARNVHLLPDAAAALGVDFEGLSPLALGRDKSAFRAEDPPIEPHRVDLVVVLAPEGDDGPPDPPSAIRPGQEAVALTEAKGAKRIDALVEHTNRDGIAPVILGQERYFAQLVRFANAAPVYVLRRPWIGWSLDAVLDLIEGLVEERSCTPD